MFNIVIAVTCNTIESMGTKATISYSDDSLREGTVATYACDHGFALKTNTRTCQNGGTWSDNDFICSGK